MHHYFLYRRMSMKLAFQRNEKVQTTTSRLSATLMLQTNQTHPVPQSVNVDARGRMPLLVIQWNNNLTQRLSLNKWSQKDASANHQTPCPAHSYSHEWATRRGTSRADPNDWSSWHVLWIKDYTYVLMFLHIICMLMSIQMLDFSLVLLLKKPTNELHVPLLSFAPSDPNLSASEYAYI